MSFPLFQVFASNKGWVVPRHDALPPSRAPAPAKHATHALPAFAAFSAVEPKSQGESPVKKFFVSGLVAWTFELAGGHFMEFLKIKKQTSSMSYAQITREMVQHKGIVGVLDGFFPWGSLQCFVKGASFGFGQALGRQMLDGHMSDSAANVLSGGFGGAFQGICMSPLLLLKTRVMTDPAFRAAGGTWETTVASTKVGVAVVQREGLGALMKGSFVFSTKRFADWTTRFFFAEQCTIALREFQGRDLGLAEKSAASFMGGVLSATVTIPIDVLVATIQDASKAGEKVSVMKVWQEKTQKDGVMGLFRFSTRGYVARVAHVALTTMLMKNVASAVYRLME